MNGEFLDLGSEKIYAEVQKINRELMSMADNVSKVNSKGLTLTPSGSNDAIKKLNADLAAQDKLIQQLQSKLTKLADTQKRNNTNDRESIINRRIQNQQTDLLIKSTSQLAGAYANLSAKEAMAARNLQNLIAEGRKAGQSQRQYNAELKAAQMNLDGYRKKLLQADEATGRWGRTNFRTVDTVRNLMGAFGIVGGITLFAAMSRDIFNTTRELQSLDLALAQVTGSQAEAAEAQAFLSDISEKYGLEIKNLTRSYTQFYVSAKDKLSGNEIRGIFDSIGKAAGAMGLSIEQQDGVFLSLTQMLSKGTVQAEELRGQLSERLPGAFGILAKSMGVTEKELGKMLEQGQVLAADVLPAFAKELEKAYNIENIQRVESLNAATTRLSNTWTDFIRNLNEGQGVFAKFITGSVESLGFLIKSVGNLFTSDEQDRTNFMKKMRDDRYNEILSYYNSMGELNKEEIAALKAQTEEWKTQLNVQLAQLRVRNSELSKGSGRFLGVFKTGANKDEIGKNEASIRRINNLLSAYNGEIMAYNALLKDEAANTKTVIELTDEQRKALERLREERMKNKAARDISDLERLKKINEDRLESEILYADEKIKLSEKIYALDYAIAQRRFVENVRLHKGSLDLQAIDANIFRNEQESAEKENQERILKIKEENFKAFQEYRQKYGRPTGNEETFGADVTFLPTEKLDELVNAYKSLNEEKAKSAKLTEEEKKAIDDWLTSFQEGFFSDAGLPTLFKVLNNEIAGFGENFAVTFNAITEIAQEAFNFINEVQQQQFEAQYERLSRERDVAIGFAGESAGAREEIERQYDARRRQIQRQQAEAEKRTAIFNTVVNTAQAIVATLAKTPPPAGIPLAAIVGAIGAAQIAVIAAQPIPQFKDGGKHKGGLMMVNDGAGSNYREIIKTPDGKISMPEGRNVIMDAPAGTEIFNASKSRQMLDNILMANGISYAKPNGGVTREDIKNGMIDAIATMPQGDSITWSIDSRGEAIYRNSHNRSTQMMNNKKTFTAKRIGR